MGSNKLGQIRLFVFILLSMGLVGALNVNIPIPINYSGLNVNYSINTNYSLDSDKLDGQHGAYYTSTYNSTYASLVTDNQSWNESYANTKYTNFSSFNSTQMTYSGGYINIIVSWLTSLFYQKLDVYNKTETWNSTQLLNGTLVQNNSSPTFINVTMQSPQFVSIGSLPCYPLKCLSWCVNGSGINTHTYYNGTSC